MTFRKFALFALIGALGHAASAATYYIDSAAGNDSNSGTSSSAPWQCFATHVNGGSFSPGDSISLKKGSTWNQTLVPPSNGSSTNPITFGNYGSGPSPVICDTSATGCASSSCTQTGGVGKGIDLSGRSYITVFQINVLGQTGTHPWAGVYTKALSGGVFPHDLILNELVISNGKGDGINLDNCNNCTVEQSTVTGNANHGIEVRAYNPDSTHSSTINSGTIFGNTVYSNGGHGITTYGCPLGSTDTNSECYANTQSGLFITGFTFNDNTVYDNGSGIYLHWTNSSTVSGNTTYDNDYTGDTLEGYCVALEASSSNSVSKNLCYGSKASCMEASNDSGAGTTDSGSSNNVIEYNVVHNCGTNGLQTDAYPSSHNQFLYNLIWNNTNLRSNGAGSACIIANGENHQFYGNTCWNNTTGIDLYTSTSTPSTGNINIENNIIAGIPSGGLAVFIEPPPAGGTAVNMSTIVFNYNDYDPDSATDFNLSGTTYNFSGWKTATSQDASSFIADPLFSSSSPSAPNDFILQATSPCIGTGVNLGSSFSVGLEATTSNSWPGRVFTKSQPSSWVVGAFIP